MFAMKEELLALFKVYLKILEELDESHLQALIAGSGTLKFHSVSSTNIGVVSAKHSSAGRKDLVLNDNSEFASKIAQVYSREEAHQLLNNGLKKTDLLNIASNLNVHVRKNDTKETIVHKIVESVVGGRLRSQAIKDTDLRAR